MSDDPRMLALAAAAVIAAYVVVRRAPGAWRWVKGLLPARSDASATDAERYRACCEAVLLMRREGEPEIAQDIIDKVFPKLAPKPPPSSEGADADR